MGNACSVVISIVMILGYYLNTMFTFPIEEVLEVCGPEVQPLYLVLACARARGAVGADIIQGESKKTGISKNFKLL